MCTLIFIRSYHHRVQFLDSIRLCHCPPNRVPMTFTQARAQLQSQQFLARLSAWYISVKLSAQTLLKRTPPSVILASIKRAVPIAQFTPPKIIVFRNSPLLIVMILPPMGEPVNAAKAAIEKTVPVRMPISWMGETCAHRTEARPTPAPEATPNSAAKAIMAPSPVPGRNKPRMKRVVMVLIIIIMLKWPSLSAKALGTVRPIMLHKTHVLTRCAVPP